MGCYSNTPAGEERNKKEKEKTLHTRIYAHYMKVILAFRPRKRLHTTIQTIAAFPRSVVQVCSVCSEDAGQGLILFSNVASPQIMNTFVELRREILNCTQDKKNITYISYLPEVIVLTF